MNKVFFIESPLEGIDLEECLLFGDARSDYLRDALRTRLCNKLSIPMSIFNNIVYPDNDHQVAKCLTIEPNALLFVFACNMRHRKKPPPFPGVHGKCVIDVKEERLRCWDRDASRRVENLPDWAEFQIHMQLFNDMNACVNELVNTHALVGFSAYTTGQMTIKRKDMIWFYDKYPYSLKLLEKRRSFGKLYFWELLKRSFNIIDNGDDRGCKIVLIKTE